VADENIACCRTAFDPAS